jgi:hypothetical protein
LAESLFEGRKTWLLLTIPFSYALILAASFKVVLFNGTLFSWFLNPHIGYVNDDFGTNVCVGWRLAYAVLLNFSV